MRIMNLGHAIFAAAMIGLGIMSLINGNFSPVWDPVPKSVPGREALVYFCAVLSLACGVGLLFRRTAAVAARLLVACLLVWLLLFRLPPIFRTPNVETTWSGGENAVMLAGAWVLYAWFATDWDKRRLNFAIGEQGLRIARILYGLALIPFGMAHFLYLKNTVSQVPRWLPGHEFWAYFTGGTLIAAGAAVLIGVWAPLAAVLSAVEIGLFTLLVWVPIIAAGTKVAYQQSEAVDSAVLTAGAWVVAESYRGRPKNKT